jgi:hypothetical protein
MDYDYASHSFWRYNYCRKWIFAPGEDYRRTQKYRKRSHHQKKVFSDKELDRKTWRKSKDKKQSAWNRGQPDKFWKWSLKRKHRAWERQMIVQGRFEEMTPVNSQRKIGSYYDWW